MENSRRTHRETTKRTHEEHTRMMMLVNLTELKGEEFEKNTQKTYEDSDTRNILVCPSCALPEHLDNRDCRDRKV